MNSDNKEFRPITDLEGRVPSIVLNSDTTGKFKWFPKPSSGLLTCKIDSQKSMKAVTSTAKIHCKEMIQIKINQSKRFTDQISEGFNIDLSSWSENALLFLH